MNRTRVFAAATTRGLRRTSNEDALAIGGALLAGELAAPLCGRLAGGAAVLAVADGLGGHAHGAVASREAVCHLLGDSGRLSVPEGCVAALRHANLHLHDLMLRRPETVGMGTTVAGIAISGDSFCWFNVGDSRIYRLRGSQLEQLSVDDRPAAPHDGSGRVSHALLQSLGGRRAISPVHPHAGQAALLPGDRLLVCSDGLTDMLADAAIADILLACPDAAGACARLLAAALHAGGRDNTSLILAQ